MSAAVQEAWAQLAIQRRRARWFEYVRRRFDMVPLFMVADWCATEPGSVVRNEGRRKQAYQDLLASILEGEFGAGDWPALANMPKPPPTYSPFCLRLTLGQITYFVREGYNTIADLWAPRPAVVEWFTRRGIGLPPALTFTAPHAAPAGAIAPAAQVTVRRPPPSAAMLREFVAAFVQREQGAGHLPTQSRLFEAWKDAKHRGSRPELIAALAKHVAPERGRPAVIRRK